MSEFHTHDAPEPAGKPGESSGAAPDRASRRTPVEQVHAEHSVSEVELPRVSIVIVSWNAIETVKKCLPSVARTAYPNFEIIFSDNASRDGTPEWIRAQFPEIKLVVNPENWAFCKGNNVAVAQASGELVVLLNNDVEVPEDWLDSLVHTLASDPSIGAVQPKVLDYFHRSRFEYAGASGGFLDRNGYPFARGRLFSTLESDNGQYDQARDVFWATGAAVMTRRQLYEEVGGLDERLYMHMEEIDFCWRLQRRGYRIVCQPASKVFHIGGASLAQGSTEKVFLNYRNNLLVLFKNLPPSEWSRIFYKRVLLDGIGLLRALLLLRPAESLAILRAYWAAHRMKGQFLLDRPERDEPRLLPSYRGNIVLDYFLRGRRSFRDLRAEHFDLQEGA